MLKVVCRVSCERIVWRCACRSPTAPTAQPTGGVECFSRPTQRCTSQPRTRRHAPARSGLCVWGASVWAVGRCTCTPAPAVASAQLSAHTALCHKVSQLERAEGKLRDVQHQQGAGAARETLDEAREAVNDIPDYCVGGATTRTSAKRPCARPRVYGPRY